MERLLDYFKPDNYQLELYIFSKEEYIQGTVTVDGVVTGQVVKFHAVDMEIAEVVFQARHWHSENITPERKCDYKYDGEVIEIAITDEMRQDLETVKKINIEQDYQERDLVVFTIKYITKLNHNMQGCYVSTYNYNGVQQKLIATQFESHYAREAFPCIDEPAAKAKFDLTLITPDITANDAVLANTPLIKQDIRRFTFATTPMMSTYLLAWVVGPLKSVSTVNRHGVKVTSYCALNQNASALEFANEVAARALDYYDEKFGIKYPLEKLDQVALPDFEAGAMENWGLVTYRESCMLAESNAAIDTKQSIALTVTHELSHQWFGDLVTMAWWDDLWLNESFATIMEYYATDALYPEFKAWQDFYTGYCVAALRRDALRGVQAVKQPVNDPAEIATLFDSAIVYAKGARLVLMLMQLMGEQNFYGGLHEYFESHQYGNTIGDDLWNALQPHADFDVKDFMHAWISQPGYPALQTAYSGDKTWWAQQRFLIDGTTDDSEWPLPEIKDDMSGHYLLDLSSQEFQKKLAGFDQLHIEQKLRLLIDRMMLAKARAVSFTSLLDVLPKFVQEDATVWEILLSIINDLKVFFPDESDAEKLYREFLRNMIHDRMREVGVTSQDNEDSNQTRLRKALTVVARFARDSEIITQLAAQYDDDISKLDAEMRGNILLAKMMQDEDKVFASWLEKYQQENDPELKGDLLFALSIVERPEHIKTVLDLLKQPEIVRPQDHLFFFIYLLRNPKTRAQAFDWLYNNWGYVEQLTGEKSIEDYPRGMSNYINTEADAKKFNDFFAPMKENPVLKRALETAQAGVEARLSLIRAESAAVQEKVRALVAETGK